MPTGSIRIWRRWALAAVSAALLACGAGGGDDDSWLFPLWLPTDVLVADLDHDGRADVVTLAQLATSMSQREGRLVVRLQTAPGVFTVAQSSVVGVYPCKLAAGDIDGDGATDLVLTDVGSTTSSADRATWLLRQDAAQRGHFQTPLRLMSNQAIPYGVALGDINGDQLPDLVIADSPASGRGATALLQDPARRGTFLAPALMTLPGDAIDVALADLNGDGRDDLVARVFLSRTNFVADTALAIRYQQAGGTLTAPVTLSPQSGLNTRLLTVADYNADGMRDVLELFSPSSTDFRAKLTTLLQSNAAGSFSLIDTSLAGVNGVDSGVVADLNGDGRPDFASVGAYPVGSPSTIQSTLNLFFQNDSGGFTPSASLTLPIPSSRLAASDLNADGLNDLVVLGNNNRVFVLQQSGTAHGSFLAPLFLN